MEFAYINIKKKPNKTQNKKKELSMTKITRRGKWKKGALEQQPTSTEQQKSTYLKLPELVSARPEKQTKRNDDDKAQRNPKPPEKVKKYETLGIRKHRRKGDRRGQELGFPGEMSFTFFKYRTLTADSAYSTFQASYIAGEILLDKIASFDINAGY